MNGRLRPEVGSWYQRRDTRHVLQVVALDEDEGIVEVQDIDGDIDEIELTEWLRMPLSAAAPPEDTRGSLDDDAFESPDEIAELDDGTHHWRDPLDAMPSQPLEEAEADEAERAVDRP